MRVNENGTGSRKVCLSAGLVFLVVLLHNVIFLAESPPPYDSSELALVGDSLGVAHPSGYPLYALLVKLMITSTGLEPGPAANLLSALTGALFLSLFALTLSNVALGRELNANVLLGLVVSLGSSLAVLSLPIFRTQCVRAEVYTLFYLFLLLGFIMFQRGVKGDKLAAVSGFLCGLAFLHHISSLFVVPVIIGAILFHNDKAGRLILLFSGFFLLAVSAYVYIPIRAARDPVINWGDVRSFSELMDHLFVKGYRAGGILALTQLKVKTRIFATGCLEQFGPVPLTIYLVGVLITIGTSRKSLWLLSGAALYLAGVILTYPDFREDFLKYVMPVNFVPVYVVIVGAGILGWCKTKSRLGFLVVLATVIVSLVSWQAIPRSETRSFATRGKKILTLVKPPAVLITSGDIATNTLLYLQTVEERGKGIIILNRNLLGREWYRRQIFRRYGLKIPPVIQRESGLVSMLAEQGMSVYRDRGGVLMRY